MDSLPSIRSSSATARGSGGRGATTEMSSPANHKRTLAIMMAASQDEPKTSPRVTRLPPTQRSQQQQQQLVPVLPSCAPDDSGGGEPPLLRGSSLRSRNVLISATNPAHEAENPATGALSHSSSHASLSSLLQQQQQQVGPNANTLGTSTSFGSMRSAQTPFMFHEQHGSVVGSFEATASTTGALLHASSSSSRSSRGTMSPASRVAASLSKGPSSFAKIPSLRSVVRVALLAHKQQLARNESDSGFRDSDSSPRRSSSIAADGLLGGIAAVEGGSGDSAVFATGDASESAAAQNASGALRHMVECACRRFLEVFDHSETRPLSFSLPNRKSTGGGGGAGIGGIAGTGRSGRRVARNSRSPETSFVGTGGENPNNSTSEPAERHPKHPSRQDSSEHKGVADLDDLGRGEDALRRYRDWSSLNRSALPGASGMKAYLLKHSTEQTSEIEKRMISRTTQWLERNGLNVLSHQPPPDTMTSTANASQIPVPLAVMPQLVAHMMSESPFATCQCPRELHCAVMTWRHRRSGSAFQRSVFAVSTALRRLMVPGALVSSLFLTTYTLGGSLVTVTWLPPLIGVYPTLVEPGSWLSDLSKQITASLLGSFFADAAPPTTENETGNVPDGRSKEDHIAAVDFYPCADGSYCAIPSVHLIDALTMHRFEMILAGEAAERLIHGAAAASPGLFAPAGKVVGGQHPQSSSTMSAEDLNRNRTVDVLLRVAPQLFGNHQSGNPESVTILRDLFHANGVEMREILVVRSQLDRLVRNSSHALSHDHVAAVKSLSQFMLSEAVARTLKAMMLSRVASQLGASSASTSGVGAAETSSGLAVDVHNPSGVAVDDPLKLAEQQATGRVTSQFRPTTVVVSSMTTGMTGSAGTDHRRFGTEAGELPAHVTTTLDAVNLVFRKFLTSAKFLRESLLPAMVKRYGSAGDIPGGLDPKTLYTLDMVAFLEHRLGFFFDAHNKTFQLMTAATTNVSVSSASWHPNPSVRLVGLHGAPVSASSPLARSLRCLSTSLTTLSPNGVASQQIATEITATLLQRLSDVCLVAEQARKEELAAGRRPQARTAKAIDVAEAVLLVYTIFPLLASTVTASEHARGSLSRQSVSGAANAGNSDIDAASSPTPAAGSLYSRFPSTVGSNYKQRGGMSGASRTRTGVGPSVLRLLDRLLRLYQLPLNAVATFRHTVEARRNSDFRQRQLVAAMDSFDISEQQPQQGAAGVDNGATAASATFDAVVQPLRAARDGLATTAVKSASAAFQVADTEVERQPVFFFTVDELSTLADLFCIASASKSRTFSLSADGRENDPSGEAADQSSTVFFSSPTYVAACDAPIVCFVCEQVTLLQSTDSAEDFARTATEHLTRNEPRKSLESAAGGFGFGGMLSAFTPAATTLPAAGSGGGAFGGSPLDAVQFRDMNRLILWSSSLRCLSAMFEPFLLHHTTRALLTAKLIHRRSTHWWIDYLHRSVMPLPGRTLDANETDELGVLKNNPTCAADAAGHEDCVEVLTSVCEAVMIGSTATLVGDGNEASFLLSFALGIATQRSSSSSSRPDGQGGARASSSSNSGAAGGGAADRDATNAAFLAQDISVEIPPAGDAEAHAVPLQSSSVESPLRGRAASDAVLSRFSPFALRCASELVHRRLTSSRDFAASSSLSLTTNASSTAAAVVRVPLSSAAAADEPRTSIGGGSGLTPHADFGTSASGDGDRPDTTTLAVVRKSLTSTVAALVGALLAPLLLQQWVAALPSLSSISSGTAQRESDRSSSLRSLLSDDERRQRLVAGFQLLLPLWKRFCAKLQDVFLQRADARRSPEPLLTPRISPAAAMAVRPFGSNATVAPAAAAAARGAEPDSGESEVISNATPSGTPSDRDSVNAHQPHHLQQQGGAESSTTGALSTIAMPTNGHPALLDEETCYQLTVAFGPAREYLVALLRVLEDGGLPALGASVRQEQQRNSVVVSSMLTSEPHSGVGRASITDALVAASSIALTDPVRARAEARAKASYLKLLPNIEFLQAVFEGLRILVKPTETDLLAEYCKPFLPGLGVDGSQLPSFDIPEVSPLASDRRSMPGDDASAEEEADLAALTKSGGQRSQQNSTHVGEHHQQRPQPLSVPQVALVPRIRADNPGVDTHRSPQTSPSPGNPLPQPSPGQLNLSSPPAELMCSVATDYTNQPPSLHGEGTNEFRSFVLDDLRVSSEQARRLSQLIGSRRSTMSQELPSSGNYGTGTSPHASASVATTGNAPRTTAENEPLSFRPFSLCDAENAVSLKLSRSNNNTTNELSIVSFTTSVLTPHPPPPMSPDSFRRGSHARRVLEASQSGKLATNADDDGTAERYSLSELHAQHQWIVLAEEDMLRCNVVDEEEVAREVLVLTARRTLSGTVMSSEDVGVPPYRVAERGSSAAQRPSIVRCEEEEEDAEALGVVRGDDSGDDEKEALVEEDENLLWSSDAEGSPSAFAEEASALGMSDANHDDNETFTVSLWLAQLTSALTAQEGYLREVIESDESLAWWRLMLRFSDTLDEEDV